MGGSFVEEDSFAEDLRWDMGRCLEVHRMMQIVNAEVQVAECMDYSVEVQTWEVVWDN